MRNHSFVLRTRKYTSIQCLNDVPKLKPNQIYTFGMNRIKMKIFNTRAQQMSNLHG